MIVMRPVDDWVGSNSFSGHTGTVVGWSIISRNVVSIGNQFSCKLKHHQEQLQSLQEPATARESSGTSCGLEYHQHMAGTLAASLNRVCGGQVQL